MNRLPSDRHRGGVLVETAVSLSVILLLFLAALQFTLYFRDRSAANTAAFYAARAYGLTGSPAEALSAAESVWVDRGGAPEEVSLSVEGVDAGTLGMEGVVLLEARSPLFGARWLRDLFAPLAGGSGDFLRVEAQARRTLEPGVLPQ